ncbi:GntR family transcriptional regulator [Streptomyces sp. NPDC001493]
MASNIVHGDKIIRDAGSRYRTTQREEGGARGAFDGEVRRSGGTPRSEVTVRSEAAPVNVASALGLEPGTEVTVRARRMYVGDRVVQLATSYIPGFVADAAPAVKELDTGKGGIISRMSDAGYAQVSVTEDVDLEPASEDQARALDTAAGHPLLTITHIGYAEGGRPVEFTRHTLGPGWTLRYEVPVA